MDSDKGGAHTLLGISRFIGLDRDFDKSGGAMKLRILYITYLYNIYLILLRIGLVDSKANKFSSLAKVRLYTGFNTVIFIAKTDAYCVWNLAHQLFKISFGKVKQS